MTDAVRARLVRRELHSSRSLPVVIVAALVVVACVYLGIEIVLAATRQPPLIATPRELGEAILALADAPPVLVGAIGAAVVLVGLGVLASAVGPGRLARRELEGSRAVVVADDVVIASALARAVSRRAGLDPDRVTVAVSRRSAVARIVPRSGTPINVAAVTASMQDELDRARVRPALRAAVRVAPAGRVGG